MPNRFFSALLCALFCFAAGAATAQVITPKARVSQMGLATYKTDDAYLKIHYGQPYKKGRTIFGTLVPFGQVWRTGANEATELTTTTDLMLGGKLLKAGTYAIYSIPRADRWTIIFNGDLGAWGAYEYDAKKDVLRFDVPVSSTPETHEAFTVKLEGEGDRANVQMMWDQTMVTIPVQIQHGERPSTTTAP